MALEISASGQVNKDSGLVDILLHLTDGELSKPQMLQMGKVSLLNAKDAILSEIEFDRNHANSDGSFHIRSTRSPEVRTAQISITTTDKQILSKEIDVNVDLGPDSPAEVK